MALRGCLRDPRKLTYHYPRGLIVVAFMPPQTALDPPAVFALIIEQGSTPAAHVVFKFYLRVLLHIHLDCANPGLVPCQIGFFLAYFWSNSRETPFIQYRSPVGRGPSSKTCPRWPLQRAQCTSVLSIPNFRSVVVSTAPSIGAQKLGQPVRLSNFVSDEKRSAPQPAHRNTPSRYSLLRGLVPGRSVPCMRNT